MTSSSRIGIIDIGSNSIRLVIYERTAIGTHRVINECKQSARLSERIGLEGVLDQKDIVSIVPTLLYFKMVCAANGTTSIRAVATAAIRNASNSEEIITLLREASQMNIEVLTGEEEARLGFLGVVNTIDIQDGIIVDIGGGSSEVSLFRNRELLHSVSFPFGSVNTARQYIKNGVLTDDHILQIQQMVIKALAEHPWIKENPDLPLIGLGGTIRNLGKMNQKRLKYSLPLAHNYVMESDDMDLFMKWLPTIPLHKLKKIEGLSKERSDIIIPGLTIMHTIFGYSASTHYIISGSGLRDGLYYETITPENSKVSHVLEHSVYNLLALHPSAPMPHLEQVKKLASELFDELMPVHRLDERCRVYVQVSALLYRIGVSVQYYQFSKHTQYLIAQSRMDGLSHREILLCSLIASYKTKSRIHQACLKHKDLLALSDELIIEKLGTLLQLAIALDSSQSQIIHMRKAKVKGKELQLHLSCSRSSIMELREIEALQKDFHKVWGLKLTIHVEAVSMQ